MSEFVSRAQLLQTFEDLNKSFDRSLAGAKDKGLQFESLRLGFIGNMSKHLQNAKVDLSDNHPLRPSLLAFIDSMDETRRSWNERIAGRDKGVKFREKFEDSLLVFVNGKVKSGKSSLGNYMAWGNTDPSDAMKRDVTAASAPVYFSEEKTNVKGGDADHEAETRREFRVGATEATSSIQGFSLPGLTWVDSPGMHSLNIDNEKLARDYVEHADLILYTMKSDSPGRESDLDEINALFIKDKTPLILLTGSDDVEEDIADDGETLVKTVVMKAPERRAKQRDYVRSALAQTCGDNRADKVEIMSFSARYAQLHASDSSAYADSGMEQLCATLQRICRSDAVRIKQGTPMTNLHNFFQYCHKDLQPYRALMGDFKAPLNQLKQESEQNLAHHIQNGQRDLTVWIDDFFEHKLRAKDDAAAVARQLAVFRTSVNQRLQEVITEQLGKIFEEIMVGFAAAVDSAYNKSALLQLPEFKLETSKQQIASVQASTRARNGTMGAVAGGVLGFFLGGPAGAALGASVGGSLGGATGNSASRTYREIEVTVGDNLQEIHGKAIKNSMSELDRFMRSSTSQLWAEMDKKVTSMLAQLEHEIDSFDKQLQALMLATRTN